MDENAIYQSEISPKEIIKQMKENIYCNLSDYNYHLINLDYLLYRPSIFSLIRKITNRIGFKSQTYFLSIYYLDILHIKKQKIDLDLKVLSLACLLLAAKYVENDENVPNLPIFVALFNSMVGYRDLISNKELFFAEVLTCKLLEYKLNYYTIYDFDSFFFGHGIIKIEQLKELNNGVKLNNDDFNEINIEASENSFYIRKVLEKIYRKSRYYLDIIINSGNICLKYSSLIISIVIMKKSVEDILFREQNIKGYELKEFEEKTSKCFKEIMRDIYQIDYESMEEYQNLIKDSELLNIFKENNKNNSIYITNRNLKFWSDKENKNKLNINERYNDNLNKTLNGNVFIKKFNFSKYIDRNNYRKRSNSRIESEEGEFLFSNKYKKEITSAPKKINLNKKFVHLSNFNSSFSNNFHIPKNINSSKNKDQNERNNLRNILLNKPSEINNYRNYMLTYTNKFYNKKRKESNSIKSLIKNVKNINDSYENSKNIINIIDNNDNTLQDEKVLNTETVQKERNYEKYKKMILKKKFFNKINLQNSLKDYSISPLDNSNILRNINNLEEKIPNLNIQKPYFKKVIKNVTNYSIKKKSNINSFYATINNDIYNPSQRKPNKFILINQLPTIRKDKNVFLDNELSIENDDIINNTANDNKQNATLEAVKNFNNRINFINNKNSIFNHRNKLFSNNILLNSMTLDNRDDINKNKIKEEILLIANNDYINKKNNERQKLLFMRMKNINNRINFINPLNNTEIKSNKLEDNIAKRKYIFSNNIKKEGVNISQKESSENSNSNKDNKSGNNKINMNKINSFNINELKIKSRKYKYINIKNTSENISNLNSNRTIQSKVNKEKNDFKKSALYKLINRAKTLNENKLNLTKGELNLDLLNQPNKNNQNKKNKILKNMNTLDLNQDNILKDTNDTSKIMFNTIDNNITSDKKENNDIQKSHGSNKNNNNLHNYHYRNYMKNKIKKDKDKEIDINKTKNKNTNNENSKTIVINNNININFNNKIENSNIYQNSKTETLNNQLINKKIDNKEFFNNNKNTDDFNKRKNIDIKNNGRNQNISSLLHKYSFYKKTLGNDKKKLTVFLEK